jgi:hypothetical protein
MDPRIIDPFEWADFGGALVFYGILVAILVGTLLNLVSANWDDWLDERWGRGSVRDAWLLRRIERDARSADAARRR